MSLLDDVKHLVEGLPVVHQQPASKGYRYIPCSECGRALDDHDARCPAVVVPRVVAVLEAAEQVRTAYANETIATWSPGMGLPLLAAVDALDRAMDGKEVKA